MSNSIKCFFYMLFLLLLSNSANAATLIIEPIEDTYVDSDEPYDNYVGSSLLTSSATLYTPSTYWTNDTRISLLKFNLSGINIETVINSASLQLYAMSVSSPTPHIAALEYPNNSWNPLTITWSSFSNEPANLLEEVATPYSDSYYSWNITQAVHNRSQEGLVTILVKSTRQLSGFESTSFYSINTYNSSRRPKLSIFAATTTNPTPTPTPTPITAWPADMNCNGILDTGDATLILRDIVGLDIPRCWED